MIYKGTHTIIGIKNLSYFKLFKIHEYNNYSNVPKTFFQCELFRESRTVKSRDTQKANPVLSKMNSKRK